MDVKRTQELKQLVVQEKQKGMTDKEIGDKHHVSFHFIEQAVTELVGINISRPGRERKFGGFEPKLPFRLEGSTVWSFRQRGAWATHSGNYRGNWSPYIPRNVILLYSQEGETVLDCFCGAGTTGVECKLLGRKFEGIDINPNAIELARGNVAFPDDANPEKIPVARPKVTFKVGDARRLSFIEDKKIELICTHPPYADILHYTDNALQDLSYLPLERFLSEMGEVSKENHRVLADERNCAVLIGDYRKNKNIVPLGFRLIDVYRQNGFVLKELVIKRQHNCRTTGFWFKNSIKLNFLLLAHEYLAVFQKRKTMTTPAQPSESKIEYTKPSAIGKNELEGTSVWIFDEDTWYARTLGNLITRYDGLNYSVLRDEPFDPTEPQRQLVVLDWTGKVDCLNLDFMVSESESRIHETGFLAIICNDVRMNDGSIYPMGIEIEKMMRKKPKLSIKEIVIVSVEREHRLVGRATEDLTITHKYVLVYSKLQNPAGATRK